MRLEELSPLVHSEEQAATLLRYFHGEKDVILPLEVSQDSIELLRIANFAERSLLPYRLHTKTVEWMTKVLRTEADRAQHHAIFSEVSSFDELTSRQQQTLATIQRGAIPRCFRGCTIFPRFVLWRQLVNKALLIEVQCLNWPTRDTYGMGDGSIAYYVDEFGSAKRLHLLPGYDELLRHSGHRLECVSADDQFCMDQHRSRRLTGEVYFEGSDPPEWNIIFFKDGTVEIGLRNDPYYGRDLPLKPLSLIETLPRSDIYQKLNKVILCKKLCEKDADTVRSLLSADSSFGYYLDDQSNTALHHAVKLGDETLVKLVLDLAPFFRDIQNKAGDTPLHLAFQERNPNGAVEAETRERPVAIALLLLDAGANPRLRNHAGETPLLLASLLSQKSLCELLQSKFGEMLLIEFIDINQHHCQLIQLIERFQPKWRTVFDDVVAAFKSKYPNRPSDADQNPMVASVCKSLFDVAVRLREKDVARRLLDMMPLKINEFSQITKNPPLLVAIDNSDIDMVRFLIERGADPTVRGYLYSRQSYLYSPRKASAIDLVRDELKQRLKRSRDPLLRDYLREPFSTSDENLAAISEILERSLRQRPGLRMKRLFGL